MDAETRQAIDALKSLISGFGRDLDAIKTTLRTSQLQHASITNTALTLYDADGVTPRQYVGMAGDGTAAVVHVNGPPPPAPSTPQVFPAIGGLSIAWDGLAVDADVMPADFDHVSVHVTTENVTATASGDTDGTYLVATDADAADVAVSDTVVLTHADGTPVDGLVHTVTLEESAFGFTNIHLDPVAPPLVTGDVATVVDLSDATRMGTLSRAGSIALTPLGTVEQHVRLVAVSTSGTVSPPSGAASAVPLEAGGGDTVAPGVPVVSSTVPVGAYIDASGDARSTATVSWTAPTLNADGTPITDGSYYEVQYHPTTPAGAAWSTVAAPWTDTSVTIVELTPGTEYAFQVRAVDTSGNASAWSAPVTQTMAVDTAAPATPSAPTVAASLTAVQVTHHLTDNTGHVLADDLDHLDVYIGTTSDFTPDGTTKAGSLLAPKGMIDAGLWAVGTFQVTQTIVCYVKVIAVDKSGNASPPSIAASATALLIDSAHISDLSASKITAGTMGAEMIVGGRIATADSGARAEMNTLGIHGFRADGTETFTLSDADGSVSMLGQLQTGTSGKRIVINPDNSGLPEIRFYPSTGDNYAFANSFAYDSTQASGQVELKGSGVGINSSNDVATNTQNSLILTGDSVYLGKTTTGTGAPVEANLSMYESAVYLFNNESRGPHAYVTAQNTDVGNGSLAALGNETGNGESSYVLSMQAAIQLQVHHTAGDAADIIGIDDFGPYMSLGSGDYIRLKSDGLFTTATMSNGDFPDWYECLYANGWVHSTRVADGGLFAKILPFGAVWIQGEIQPGTTNSGGGVVVATLPYVGMNPSIVSTGLIGLGGVDVSTMSRIPSFQLSTNGQITVFYTTSATTFVQINQILPLSR